MAMLRRGHPWIAGYAIPQNVLDEGFHRGAIVSKYRKRGTIDVPPRNPREPGGYILPQSVRDEPLGQGVRTTHYRKRGTISGLVPEVVTARNHTGRVGIGGIGIFDSPLKGGRLGVLSGSSLGGNSVLGALGDAPGGGRDGIAQFAKDAAGKIMADARTVPADLRSAFVQGVLATIDEKYPDQVEAKAAQLMKEKQYDAKTALQKGIAVVFANELLGELMQIGKTGQIPTSGLMGLGMCSAQAGLDGVFSTVKSAVKKTVKFPVKAAKKIGKTTKKAAVSVKNAVKKAVNKVGQAICKVSNSGLLQMGATVGGTAAGGPGGAATGAAGATAVQSLCAKEPAPVEPPPPPAPAASSIPIVPIAIAGGALLLILALR